MSSTPLPHIAAVVLNYNSAEDTKECVTRLSRQQKVKVTTIVVDNASAPEQQAQLLKGLLNQWPNLLQGTWPEIEKHLPSSTAPGLVLIQAEENRGYSAGNNMGIAVADALGCQSALIINPDAHVKSDDFLSQLHAALMADPLNFAAGPRIQGLSGRDENPLRESGFWEELLWPVTILRRRLNKLSTILPIDGRTEPYEVPKISGTCLLLRMSYLRESHYLDDNVFLYCEEPILAARVHRDGGRLIFVPSTSVLHTHRKSAKGRLRPRLLAFVKSRGYYLRTYSSHGRLAQNALIASHYLFAWIVGLKDLLPVRRNV